MSDKTETKKEVDLLEIIREIESGGEVSRKLGDVETLRKNLENYVAPFKGKGKTKPNDFAAVNKAITQIKEAEKAFEIDEKEMYSSSKAKSAEKKIDKWIRTNATNSTAIIKVLHFREKVVKASKKPKASAPKTIKAYSVEIAHKALDAIKDSLPAGKKEIKEALEAKAEKVVNDGKEKLTYLGKAVSGVVNDITRAGQDAKCETVSFENKKYDKKN